MKTKKQVLYLALAIDFLFVLVSGLVLKFSHKGYGHRGAFPERHMLCDLHFIGSMLLLALLLYHFWLCRKQIRGIYK